MNRGSPTRGSEDEPLPDVTLKSILFELNSFLSKVVNFLVAVIIPTPLEKAQVNKRVRVL